MFRRCGSQQGVPNAMVIAKIKFRVTNFGRLCAGSGIIYKDRDEYIDDDEDEY